MTVIFETIDANEELTEANDGIFPSPLAANPILVLSFVQEYVAVSYTHLTLPTIYSV